MSLLYHAYVYLGFLILACTIYILASSKSQGDAQEAGGTEKGPLGSACEKQCKRRTLSVRLPGASRDEPLIGAVQTTG